jgi:pimeloyl-ACP methyl ester carboxylesterase
MAIVGSIGLHLEGIPIDTGQGRRPEDMIRRMFHDQKAADEYLAEGVLENSFDENRDFMNVAKRILPDHPIDLAKDLPRLVTPTLVLWGENDQIAPVSYAYEFVRLLPNAKLFIIQECGHLAQIEKPLESHREIAEFLRGRIT